MSAIDYKGAQGKKFTLFASAGPNPWKVVMILHELGFTNDYNLVMIPFGNPEKPAHKSPEFTKFNPNGRSPAFVDHSNNDFVIWESGAILYYLIEKYDTEHKISFSSLEEKSLAIQYLMFQMSGQGPYFGQAVWFAKYHPEKVPTAFDRYVKEIYRVLGVLETIIEGKDFLVGNKFSYVDAAFVPWDQVLDFLTPDHPEFKNWQEQYPNVARWHNSVLARPAVKEAYAVRAAATAST